MRIAKNIQILFLNLQNMHQPDHCQENLNQACTPFYDYHNGYFGKPTKLRASQPSMFELLTWDGEQTVNRNKSGSKNHEHVCHCHCNEQNSVNQNEHYVIGKNINNMNKKMKQGEQNRCGNKKISQTQKKILQQKELKNRTQGRRSPKNIQINKENHLSRPKTAGNNVKTVKILTSPIKNQRLAPQPTGYEEQSLEVKQKLIQKFKQTTRWIPNSSFTTYFGKPAFENYGRCNTNPACGGLMYGNYLKTHNIQPHRGVNSPKSIQTYNVALMKAQEAGPIYPYPPKVARKQSGQRETNNDLQMSKSQIYPENNNIHSLQIHPPQLYDLQKFGGKGIKKVARSKFDREKENENYSEYEGNNSGNNGIRSSKRFANQK